MHFLKACVFECSIFGVGERGRSIFCVLPVASTNKGRAILFQSGEGRPMARKATKREPS